MSRHTVPRLKWTRRWTHLDHRTPKDISPGLDPVYPSVAVTDKKRLITTPTHEHLTRDVPTPRAGMSGPLYMCFPLCSFVKGSVMVLVSGGTAHLFIVALSLSLHVYVIVGASVVQSCTKKGTAIEQHANCQLLDNMRKLSYFYPGKHVAFCPPVL